MKESEDGAIKAWSRRYIVLSFSCFRPSESSAVRAILRVNASCECRRSDTNSGGYAIISPPWLPPRVADGSGARPMAYDYEYPSGHGTSTLRIRLRRRRSQSTFVRRQT